MQAFKRGVKRTRTSNTSSAGEHDRACHEGGAQGCSVQIGVENPIGAQKGGGLDERVGDDCAVSNLSGRAAQSALRARSPGEISARLRGEPSAAVRAQVGRWLLLRCGAWNRVWKTLTPVLWGSADQPAVPASSTAAHSTRPAHKNAKDVHSIKFVLPGTFDRHRDVVAFAAVTLCPASTQQRSAEGQVEFHLSSEWPGRGMYLNLNGAAVPSVSPEATHALVNHLAIDAHSRSAKLPRRAGQRSLARDNIAPQEDVVNLAMGCTPGRNELIVHSAMQNSVAFRLFLCQSTWSLRHDPRGFLSQSTAPKLGMNVCVASMKLAAGAVTVRSNSGASISVPPLASAAFRHACHSGQLSAALALLKLPPSSAKERSTTPHADDENSEVAIETASIVVSLLDPLTQSHMLVPVRGLHCQHVACFDLGTWLATLTDSSTKGSHPPMCPICGAVVHASELVEDTVQQAFLSAVAKGRRHGCLGNLIDSASETTLSSTVGGIDELPDCVEVSKSGTWAAV